jgi:CBS-domain-containing membrane protein
MPSLMVVLLMPLAVMRASCQAHTVATGDQATLDEAIFTADDLMTRDVVVVHPEASLLEAVNLMVQRRISGLPVVDDAGAIVGMISEGDLLRWHEGYSEDRRAGSICWPTTLRSLRRSWRNFKRSTAR